MDTDGDGFGQLSESFLTCDAPDNAVDNAEDCDDDNPDVYPGAEEYCNGIDDNCDGQIDEGTAVDAMVLFYDADGDGFGAGQSVQSCAILSSHVAFDGDCNDGNSSISPDALEYCNGFDDDCNGSVDDSAVDTVVYYTDSDSDGHGSWRIRSTAVKHQPHASFRKLRSVCLLCRMTVMIRMPGFAQYAELCTLTVDGGDGDAVYNAIDATLYAMILIRMAMRLGLFDAGLFVGLSLFPLMGRALKIAMFRSLVMPEQDPSWELCNAKLDRCEDDDGVLTPPPMNSTAMVMALWTAPSMWCLRTGKALASQGRRLRCTDAEIYPGAMERCGIYDDCSSLDGSPSHPWMNSMETVMGRSIALVDFNTWLGSFAVTSGADCDDTNPNVYTGAALLQPEICTQDLDGDFYADCRFGECL